MFAKIIMSQLLQLNQEDAETLFGKDFNADEAFNSIDRNRDEQVNDISDYNTIILLMLIMAPTIICYI